ncbi:MAG TPA: ABC-2 family transporter protein [Clostridia bacterium]|nr:ABC-2 family transporter protein [Clostridia bacterium]
MRVFAALLKFNLKIMIQYRASFMASLIGDPIVLLIHIASFTAIYAYNDSGYIVGYDLTQMIWYFAGITLIWYCIWNPTDSNIARKILSGDLTIDLLKPVSVFKFELTNAIALRMMAIVLEFIPSIIIYSIIFKPKFITVFSFMRFMLVIIMSFMLYFLINYLIGLTAFAIKSNYSLQSIKFVIISLTAGAFIPLDFFPEWLNRIISFLPFQYLFYWPIQIFLNKEDVRGTEPFCRILGLQLVWIAGLFLLSKLLWKKAIKKYCAVGG